MPNIAVEVQRTGACFGALHLHEIYHRTDHYKYFAALPLYTAKARRCRKYARVVKCIEAGLSNREMAKQCGV